MGFPHETISPFGRQIDHISTFLKKEYPNRFMIWNLSEKSYDYSKFNNQVIEFRFPGYPSAPLDQIFSICNSIHAWLTAEPKNVAVIHCQSGRGRTVATVASYLTWTGRFKTTQAALAHICRCREVTKRELQIPTQLRYLKYVDNLLIEQFPSPKPLRLERVILNGIPSFENNQCRPYLQIFKNAKLLSTTLGRDGEKKKDSEVVF